MNDEDGTEWLTPTDAAARLGIPRSLIYVWLHRGSPPIERVKAGRYVAVNMADLAHAELAWRQRKGGHQRPPLKPVATTQNIK